MRRLASVVRDALGRKLSPQQPQHPEFPGFRPQQLRMAISGTAARQCQFPEVPFGYRFRGFRPGDEGSWIELIATEFERWDRVRFDAFLSEPERQQGSRVIEHDGRIVAATFASCLTTQPLTGSVDYVVCNSAHRGRKLGLITCGAVTRYLGKNGYQSVSLLTDDWRLAAIRVYFDLGFTPIINRIDMPARWEAIRQQLEIHSST